MPPKKAKEEKPKKVKAPPPPVRSAIITTCAVPFVPLHSKVVRICLNLLVVTRLPCVPGTARR